jgi:hypothetical protein
MHTDRLATDIPTPGRTATGSIDYDHYRAIARAERGRAVREMIATTAAWFRSGTKRSGGPQGRLVRDAAAACAR